METLKQLEDICRETFEDDEIVISRATTAADVEGWDSLMHVTLMVNIEAALGVRFTSSEVAGFANVGELVDLIEAKNS